MSVKTAIVANLAPKPALTYTLVSFSHHNFLLTLTAITFKWAFFSVKLSYLYKAVHKPKPTFFTIQTFCYLSQNINNSVYFLQTMEHFRNTFRNWACINCAFMGIKCTELQQFTKSTVYFRHYVLPEMTSPDNWQHDALTNVHQKTAYLRTVLLLLESLYKDNSDILILDQSFN